MAKRAAGKAVRDVGALKALAHPMRMRLLHALSALGEATVSALAAAVDASPALVSYHLRELAAHGFVQDVPGQVDGRAHVYRRTPGGISWATADFAHLPAGPEVAATAMQTNIAHQFARLDAWNAHPDQWAAEWVDASLMADTMLRLTPTELQEMTDELLALVERYRAAGAKAARRASADDDRQAVFVFMHAFPTQP